MKGNLPATNEFANGIKIKILTQGNNYTAKLAH
jgi:hypothetical protein